MKRYLITYRQSRDSETQKVEWRGYDADHAEERFLDSMDEDGGSEGVLIESVFHLKPSKRVKAIFA